MEKSEKPKKPENVDEMTLEIPEDVQERLEELRNEFNAFQTSYNARMHENLVGIARRLKIDPQWVVVYGNDFKTVIAKKDG